MKKRKTMRRREPRPTVLHHRCRTAAQREGFYVLWQGDELEKWFLYDSKSGGELLCYLYKSKTLRSGRETLWGVEWEQVLEYAARKRQRILEGVTS